MHSTINESTNLPVKSMFELSHTLWHSRLKIFQIPIFAARNYLLKRDAPRPDFPPETAIKKRPEGRFFSRSAG